jgi:transposase-like protein
MKRCSGEEKKMWLEDWKESGKSAWNYAKENGLNPQTFYKWARENTDVPQQFVEIKTQPLETAGHRPEILIEKGDIKIRMPMGINLNELRAVIECLRRQL